MSHKATIIRANKMGFRSGVMKAVRLCEDILQEPRNANKKKYILGMLVHNDFVVRNFEEKGFITLQESEISSLQKGDIVVIRAHGITKEIQQQLEEKELELYDATCVFVSQIKLKILRSEEHTSELQSRQYLVCRLLLEKKKKNVDNTLEPLARRLPHDPQGVVDRV